MPVAVRIKLLFRIFCALLVLGGVMVALWAVLPRWPLPGPAVHQLQSLLARQLSRRWGGRVSFESATLEDAAIELGNVVVDGEASAGADAVTLRVGTALLHSDWAPLTRGELPAVTRVELRDVHVVVPVSALEAPDRGSPPRLLQAALDAGPERLQVRGLSVSLRPAAGEDGIDLEGAELAVERFGGELRWVLHADRLRQGDRELGELHAIGSARGTEVRLGELTIDGGSLRAEVSGRARWDTTPPALELSASVRLGETRLARLLRRLPRELTRGAIVEARAADGSLRLSVRAKIRVDGIDGRARVRGQLSVGPVRLRRAHGLPELSVSRIESAFDYRLGPGSSLSLPSIEIETPAGRIQGWARVSAKGHHVQLTSQALDLSRWGRRAYGIEAGLASGQLVVDGSSAHPLRTLWADFAVRDLLWRAGDGGSRDVVQVALKHFAGRAKHQRGRWHVAEAQLRGAQLQLAGGGVLDVNRASGELERDGERWRLSRLEAEVGARRARKSKGADLAAKLRGELRFERDSHVFDGEVENARGAWLDAALPAGLEGGTMGGTLRIEGTREAPLQRVSGQLRLKGASWRWAGGPAALSHVSLKQASADVEKVGDDWSLASMKIETDVGRLEGRLQGGGGRHRGTFRIDAADSKLWSAFLPGRLRSGQLGGHASLRGTAARPLTELRGNVQVLAARWEPPPELRACDASVWLAAGRAHYSWTPSHLLVDDIRLETNLFRASGSATRRNGTTRWRGVLTSTSVGPLLDLFPALSGRTRAGRGSARLAGSVSSAGASGWVEARIADGVLVLPGVRQKEPEHAHPVRNAIVRYEFSPSGQRLRGLKIRGPELNLDLDAAWSEQGPLSGGGRLWLTRSYTDEVTGGGRWALQLLGYPRIDTRFRLSGVRDDIRLDADMAHGLRWRVLRAAVPDSLEKIARGQAPLLRADPAQQISSALCAAASTKSWTNAAPRAPSSGSAVSSEARSSSP